MSSISFVFWMFVGYVLVIGGVIVGFIIGIIWYIIANTKKEKNNG